MWQHPAECGFGHNGILCVLACTKQPVALSLSHGSGLACKCRVQPVSATHTYLAVVTEGQGPFTRMLLKSSALPGGSGLSDPRSAVVQTTRQSTMLRGRLQQLALACTTPTHTTQQQHAANGCALCVGATWRQPHGTPVSRVHSPCLSAAWKPHTRAKPRAAV